MGMIKPTTEEESHATAATTTTTGADAVGQRLSLRIGKVECPGIVIAYFPKTEKHRIRLQGTDGSSREKNFRLQDTHCNWLKEEDDKTTTTTTATTATTPSYDLAIRRDAVGRRLEIYHQVRQKWYQGTILRYVEHCQQHALLLEPQGKVHLVDLSEQAWRFTDLIGDHHQQQQSDEQPQQAAAASQQQQQQQQQSLATSRYMGVQRFTACTWKAYYYLVDSEEELYIGCFGKEKDAALAYDVYARKRGTPVNFSDRRICRKGIKLLTVPEPEVAEESPEAVVSSDVTTTTTSPLTSPHPELTPEPESATSGTVDHQQLTTTKEPECEEEVDTPALMEDRLVDEVTATDLDLEKEREMTKLKDAIVETTAEEASSNDKPTIDMTEEMPEPPSGPKRRISVDDDDDEDDVIQPSIRTKTKKAASAVKEEDSEFEFDDEEEQEEEASTSSSDDEDEEVQHRPQRRKKRTKPLANLFDSSDEEEEEEERKIALKMTKGHARVLQELGDFNTPPVRKKDRNKKRRDRSERKKPSYPVGTRFLKEFPGYGTFEGQVTEWDGKSYHVFYPEDEDREEFSESEFDNCKIISVPKEGTWPDDNKNRKRKKRRKQAYHE